jgi:hypothetical protein
MAETPSAADARPSAEERGRHALAHIEEALRGLQYGTVTITVQDGVVVQVERAERRRLYRIHRKD